MITRNFHPRITICLKEHALKNQAYIFLMFLFIDFSVLAQDNRNNVIVESVSKYIDVLVKQGKFNGVVLIAKDGEPILKEAHGYANISFKVPNKEDTKFGLASMGKMFTALAIMQLFENGKLKLHDKVIKYLPNYPNKKIANSVTIHQLLTHTSGMGNYWTETFSRTSKERFKKVNDYLPLFVDQELSFIPGTEYRYSNSGYMVLGMIIEAVSKKSYFDYVKENIFQKAQMYNTDAYEVDKINANLAEGYTKSKDGHWMNNLFLRPVKGGPAGGSYSTAEDLLKFSIHLVKNKFLTETNTKILTTGKSNKRNNTSYAYGFGEEIIEGDRIIGHSGGFPGVRTVLMIFPETGFTAIILSNKDDGSFLGLQSFIKKQISDTIKN
jgi:D-alanyl-D-alanine carboxypeptidase